MDNAVGSNGQIKTEFKILTIDGGGIRGAFAAHLLHKISEITGINPVDYFDLIVATSTGSIIAGMLVSGKSSAEIIEFFKTKGEKAFAKRKLSSIYGLLCSRYDTSPLREVLDELIGEVKLGEISKPLIIPATDIGNGTVHVLKSAYRPGFVRDPHVKLTDAILASCAAPPYFDPHPVDTYLLADGGLWCNNPMLVGLTEAMTFFKRPINEVKVLSLGTGTGKKYYSIPQKSGVKLWGLLTRWKHKRLIEMILNLQQANSANIAGLLLSPENYLRLSFESESALALDDPTTVASLISRADQVITHNHNKIKEFFEGKRQ